MMHDFVIRTPPPAADRPPASLEIVRVEAIPVALPLEKPVLMAGERIDRALNLIVRVEATTGLVGWGEAASAPLMTGEVLPGMVAAVSDHLAPLVKGQDAMQYTELAQRCGRALLHNSGAKCALDMAIHDLAGRQLGVALADLYGGAVREAVKPMYLLGNPCVEDDVAEARRKLAEGYGFFKLKIGIKPPLEEAAAAVEIRRALGPGVALCADANMGMSFADARSFAEHAREAGLLFIEQPLPAGDFEGMAALARVSAVPLNGDESIDGVESLRALHRMGAIRGANIKTIKMGGMGAAVHALGVCAELGLHINLSCKVAESSIAAAAMLQLACIAPNLDWGVGVSHHYLAQDLTDAPIAIVRGEIRRPRGPGLGVSVDEARVRRFQVK